jgi:hypothetical protein
MPRDGGEPTGLIEHLSVMEAREDNPTRLADRLRSGISLSQAERHFLADLIEGEIKPRKSRPTKSGESASARKRYAIVQAVLYIEAIHPEWQRKTIIPDVGEVYGVSPRFVFKLLSEFDPKQLEAISLSAAAFAEWQSTIAHK